jgi:hypothetical protein
MQLEFWTPVPTLRARVNYIKESYDYLYFNILHKFLYIKMSELSLGLCLPYFKINHNVFELLILIMQTLLKTLYINKFHNNLLS